LLEERLQGLGLRINSAKAKAIGFNFSGATYEPRFPGNQNVEYLGLRIHRSGAISISPLKTRSILQEIQGRLRRSAAQLPTSDEDRLRVLCQITNQALLGDATLGALNARVLMNEVNDRKYLKDLDRRILRLILLHATGQGSVKALRKWSPSDFYGQMGLCSLEYFRNFPA
jgi:hypothetical protein